MIARQNSDFDDQRKKPAAQARKGAADSESLSDLSQLKNQMIAGEGKNASTEISMIKEPPSPLEPQSSSRPSQKNPTEASGRGANQQ